MKFINILIFILFTLKITAQTVISGQVLAANEPLIGASVSQKNTTRGTTTDVDGKFRLELSSTSDVILVSYTGFLPQEITVGTQRYLPAPTGLSAGSGAGITTPLYEEHA